jgi:SAM-dependent methyltransferase
VSLGRAIRTRLGRFEAPVSDYYRSQFIDLYACATLLAHTFDARAILEIGCGDGQMANRLLQRFPAARYEGIDIAPEVGGLFHGDVGRARFRTMDSATLARETNERFDLVVVVDVLHHVPAPERTGLVRDVRELTAVGGKYVIKDWVRSRSIVHAAAWASDRLLTGDRVSYFDVGELEMLVPNQFPDDMPALSATVPPHRNNVLVAYTRSS